MAQRVKILVPSLYPTYRYHEPCMAGYWLACNGEQRGGRDRRPFQWLTCAPRFSHFFSVHIPTFSICMAGESMVGIMNTPSYERYPNVMTSFTVGTLLPTVGVAILCKQVITLKPLD